MINEAAKKIEIGQKYIHYKNRKEYIIIAVGTLQASIKELDHVPVVIYQALYNDPVFGNNHIWVRPVDDFLGMVEHAGQQLSRFELKGE